MSDVKEQAVVQQNVRIHAAGVAWSMEATYPLNIANNAKPPISKTSAMVADDCFPPLDNAYKEGGI